MDYTTAQILTNKLDLMCKHSEVPLYFKVVMQWCRNSQLQVKVLQVKVLITQKNGSCQKVFTLILCDTADA